MPAARSPGGKPAWEVGQLDNQPASNRTRTSRRTYAPASRALAATGVLVLSVYALNLSGKAQELRPAVSAVSPSGSADNAAGRADARSGKETKGPAGVVLPAPDGHAVAPLPNSLLADPQALVPFPRPSVAGFGMDAAELRINLTGRSRPPAGYLMSPLEHLNPSSPYGYRVSPLSGEDGDFHLGQDYAAPCGTKVHAADSGTVRAAGWHPWGGGNRVEIDHGNGLVTTYNHLDSIAVERGDTVHAGEVIARVGTTGWSTGCHLHFETILNGHHTSPLAWKLLPLKALDGQMPDDLRNYLPRNGAPSDGTKDWAVSVPGNRETAKARKSTTAAPPSSSAAAAPTPDGPRYASTPAARSDSPAPGSGAAPASSGASSSPSSTVTPTNGPTPSQSAPTQPAPAQSPPPFATPDPVTTSPAPAAPAPEPSPTLLPVPLENLPQPVPTLIDPTPPAIPSAPAPTATTPPPSETPGAPTPPAAQNPAAAEPPAVVQPTEPAPSEASAVDPAAAGTPEAPPATDPAAVDPAATEPAAGVTVQPGS